MVGGFGVLVSAWAYGLGHPGPPDGPLVPVLSQPVGAPVRVLGPRHPGELFFAIGLFALLGRGLVAAYTAGPGPAPRRPAGHGRVGGRHRSLSLDPALILNLVALGLTGLAILVTARRGGFLGQRPSFALLREALGFGTRAVPGSLAERLQFRADTFLVNAILGVRATGIYSVTSGLAETLWYIPNALGVVMFSRAVVPGSDPGRVAAVLTRTTIAVTAAMAIPTFFLGPYLVRAIYGSAFTDAGVALRFILPGIVAYSAVAVLTRYITGRGRPGATTDHLRHWAWQQHHDESGPHPGPTDQRGGGGVIDLLRPDRRRDRPRLSAAFRPGLAETIIIRPSDIRAIGPGRGGAERPPPGATG